MKQTLIILLILSCYHCIAQKIEKFYDYQWNETEIKYARFYSVMQKTDSGWHRKDFFLHGPTLQMDGTYEDTACKVASGKFVFVYPNKIVESYGQYQHGKKQGLWLGNYYDGTMSDSTVYDNGNPIGTGLKWHQNGYISDSAVYRPDGSGVEVEWFNNGNPSAAGVVAAGYQKHGKWQYFYKSGGLSAVELYDHGKLIDKQYFDEQGGLISDTTSNDTEAGFPGGNKAWAKYLDKQLFFPPQYEIVNSDKAVVVISFAIDEDGKVQDAYVSTPFYPQFDKIALDAIRRSPNWHPARSHNRKVRYFARQPVTFSQPED